MTIHRLNFAVIDPSWHECISSALEKMDKSYLEHLEHSENWLPGAEKIFSAFSIPVDKVNYVLIGESPYPRRESANGYAFWDNAVDQLWSASGLDKKVNRATSLRNILKMMLVAEGRLETSNTAQDQIAAIDKRQYVKTGKEFFGNFIQHGFLLLNATLVLQDSSAPQKDAKQWQPFTKAILDFLISKRPHVKLILLGRIANTIDTLIPDQHVSKIYAEHPYNLSFITNPNMLSFFGQLRLLIK